MRDGCRADGAINARRRYVGIERYDNIAVLHAHRRLSDDQNVMRTAGVLQGGVAADGRAEAARSAVGVLISQLHHRVGNRVHGIQSEAVCPLHLVINVEDLEVSLSDAVKVEGNRRFLNAGIEVRFDDQAAIAIEGNGGGAWDAAVLEHFDIQDGSPLGLGASFAETGHKYPQIKTNHCNVP